MLRRACLVSLLVLVATAVAYFVVLSPYFEWPGNALAAILGSVFAAAFVGSLSGLWQASKDGRLISRAEAGERFEDGKLMAAIGRIRLVGPALEAPFSGVACVAYEYDVSHVVTDSSRSGNDSRDVQEAAGFALTPSRIDAPGGAVRLLGFAMLDDFPRSKLDAAGRARAAAYFAATPGTHIPRGRVFKLLDAMSDALADDDGAVRADWKMAETVDLAGSTLTERTVAVGAEVCALGVYSADRNGLVAKGRMINRLVPGGAAAARHRLVGDAKKKAAAGIAFFLASHGLLGAMLYMSETRHAREPEQRQWSVLLSAAQDHDEEALARAVRRGADPNARDASGKTVLFSVREPEMVRALLRVGADPNARDRATGEGPLTTFARYGDLESVKLLVEGGAGVDAASMYDVTPLRAAIEAGRDEVADYLRSRGATDPIVTEKNGRPLPADGGEPYAACKAYLAAIQAGDVPELIRLSIGRTPAFYSGVDFDVWRKTRPREPRFLGGYATSTEATLAVGGDIELGSGVTWNYHLRRAANGWKVAREWSRE